MHYLNQFIKFDFEKFADGKIFQVTGCGEWKEYETGRHMGTRVDVVIIKDNTQYKPSSTGAVYSNIYEKVTFKISRDVSVPVGSLVVPVDAVCTVYGERRNLLSVKCAGLRVITPTTSGGKSNA